MIESPRPAGRVRAAVGGLLVVAMVATLVALTGSAGADTVIQRVNAGGPAVAGSPEWSSDTSAAPSPLRVGNGGDKVSGTGAAIDTSDPSLPAGTPAALFQSERWDPLGKGDMTWSIPTAGGTHRVTLFFAETYAPLGSVGARVFDVDVEGLTVLDDFDVFAAAGAINKGIARSFTIESDGQVDISFAHVTQNPIVNAIEVVRVDGVAPTPTLAADPLQVDFGSVDVGQTAQQSVTLTNAGASDAGDLTVTGLSVDGAAAASFSVPPGVVPTAVPPGGSVQVPVTFAPAGAGAAAATLLVEHDGANDTVSIPLTGFGVGPVEPGVDVIRVNAGGPQVDGDPVWGSDSAGAPSPLRVAGGDNAASTAASIDMSDPSVPAGTPMSLFQTERWDPPGGQQMTWSIPTDPGTYQVHLYFAETYLPVATPGGRVFDVLVQDQVVLDDFDVVAAAGAPNRGIVRSFTAESDGQIDVKFANGVQNPIVNAIAVEAVSAAPAPVLDTWPESVEFPATQIGDTSTTQVALIHSGAANSGTLDITEIAVGGSGQDQVSLVSPPALPLQLEPGGSAMVELAFSPTSAEPVSATLSLTHNGVSSPTVLSISGATPAPASLATDPSAVTFPATTVGTTSDAQVTLTNLGVQGSADIEVTSLQLLGPDAGAFGAQMASPLPTAIPATATAELSLSFAPTAAGARQATLQIEHTGVNSPLAVPLDGTALAVSDSQVLYRVNAGGGQVDGDPTWSADTGASPSQFLAAGGENVYGNGGTIDMGHPSIPEGTPAELFNSERWDPFKNPQMQWSFPTSPGEHEVRLYFAENWAPNETPGARIFDVVVEGEEVLSSYDIYSEAGAGNRAVMESFVVQADDSLDIAFVNGADNPKISAIEVLAVPTGPGVPELTAQPSPVVLPASDVGQTVTTTVDLTHTGPADSGPLEIASLSLDGPDADQFGLVGPSLPLVLQPGDSVPVDVSLTRTTADALSASLVVDHDAPGAPTVVPLSSFRPQLGASPNQISFPSTVTGNASTGQVTLTNEGDPGAGPITVVESLISGSGSSSFGDSFTDGTPVVLEPGESTVVDVTFSPTVAGATTASLAFTHDGAGGTTAVTLSGTGQDPQGPGQIGFGKSTIQDLLNGFGPRPTSLDWGPDGRLYITTLTGQIIVATIERNGPNDYQATDVETIQTVRNLPNHNDDGTVNTSLTNRMITGIEVAGTAQNPVVYVVSSDPRIGSPATGDLGMDTNSGVLSRLTWTGATWDHDQLVRGLPRSKEQHSVQGLVLDGSTLYLMSGGQTNHGAPSANFQLLPEYALSAAILTVDLDAIGDGPYDLPTLDDEDRPGTTDQNDPFGGNSGKNQAKLVPGGPVQVYAAGLRNPYDAVMTPTGLYTIDNGGNFGWGGAPQNEGPQGTCTNAVDNTGPTLTDSLHRITGPGSYGGHPNPTRGNTANTFNASNPQSPVTTANPVECDWLLNSERGALAFFPTSTNGIAQYTTGNFGGALSGDLLAAGWDNIIYRIDLDATGTQAVAAPLFNNVGGFPLDVIASDENSPFPGTILTADYGTRFVYIYEPTDYDGVVGPECTGEDSFLLDEDSDGYSNADELANGTDPCSAGDMPADFDGDQVSDLLDADDDGDGTPDVDDPFALDPDDGLTTPIPLDLPWDSDTPLEGKILGLGLTGSMTNGQDHWLETFDRDNMTVIGAAGVVTVDAVPANDALGARNDQLYGLQVGVDARPTSTGPFEASTLLPAPFSSAPPLAGHSYGIQMGAGDQDNYVKLVLAADNGGELQVVREVGGVAETLSTAPLVVPGPPNVRLFLAADPSTATVQAQYQVGDGTRQPIGDPFTVPSGWFTDSGLAVGLISTSGGAASPLNASWDYLSILPVDQGPDGGDPGDPPAPEGTWTSLASQPQDYESVSLVEVDGLMYLGGGGCQGAGCQGYHRVYDPATAAWSELAPIPENIGHVQSVAVGGKIYYIGGMLPGYDGAHLDSVHVYDTATDSFSAGTPMPPDRARASAGIVAHDGLIYVAGGIRDGHDGSSHAMFDVYDPVAGTWTALPDMPRQRDHASAAVVGDKIYLMGGRVSPLGTGAMIPEVDVYDITTGTWTTLGTTLPTLRAGAATVAVGTEVVIMGGETDTGVRPEVEAYDTVTGTWRSLTPMPTPRHGSYAAVCGGAVYLAGGSTAPLYNPTQTFESLTLPGAPGCGP